MPGRRPTVFRPSHGGSSAPGAVGDGLERRGPPITATSTTESSHFGYRPHLDGLRTVAVYLVVVFHAGADRLAGGFIGVDLFFVLSGYLVTHVLLGDLWTTGSVSLARFYARRARRLLPAAFVTLVGTAALSALVASPVELRAAVDSFRAAFVYIANWHFVAASTDYFAADLDANPVLHYWSLSIEEQFYVVWPLALIGLAALRRRFRRGDAVVRGVVGVLVVASALWALHLAQGDVNRAYYGTDARAYQLLAGALLAMSPGVAVAARLGRRGRRLAGVVGGLAVGSLVVLATSYVEFGPVVRGIAATVAAVAALAALEAADPASPVRRLLSLRPVVELGKISYGTYLWHWPVIVVLGKVVTISPLATAVIAGVVATGLAALSSQLLELPIRRSAIGQHAPRLVALGGVTASALVGLAVVPRILDASSPTGDPVAAAAPRTGASVGVGVGDGGRPVDWLAASEDRAEARRCVGISLERCRLVDAGGPSIVVLGDSHAVMVGPALEEIARRRGYDLYVPGAYGCSWHIGLLRMGQPPDQQRACLEAQEDWYGRIIPELDPALVVVIQRAVDDPDRPIAMVGEVGAERADDQGAVLRATADATLDRLEALGVPTVIVESVPVVASDRDPVECLSTAEEVEACRYVASEGPTPLEEHYAARAGDQIRVVNLDAVVCPYFPICDPVVDGAVVKWDETHITTTFARTVSDQIEDVLNAAGVLPRG